MKLRQGFVSNSSSCSFTILKKGLSEEQLHKIRNHIHYAIEMGYKGKKDGNLFTPMEGENWVLVNEEKCILADTTMDNFDLYGFLMFIGVPKENIIDYWHSNG